MVPHRIVLLEGDLAQKHSLELTLRETSGHVYTADSLGELRRQIALRRADVAVVNMELASLPDVKQLTREFPATSIVCHHRLADENLWTAVMNAGASDICSSGDSKGIARAVTHVPSRRARGMAA